MLCLFPSLFFPSHAPFVFVSCFYHFPLACSLFCHHFIKTNNEMMFFNAHCVGCFGFVFNLFLHCLFLHFVDVCTRVSPFFHHPLRLSLSILFGFPPPPFSYFPSSSLPVCVCSLPQSTSISQSSCFLSHSLHHPRSPPSPLPSTQSPSSTTACQTFPKMTTSSATRPLHTHCGPSP